MKIKLLCSALLSSVFFLSVYATATDSSVESQARAYAKKYLRPKGLPPFPADNPYSKDKAELGKVLYFEPRMSQNGYMSCVSCHIPTLGWQEGLGVSPGVNHFPAARKSQTIYDLAYSDGPFAWDGKPPTLEAQAKGGVLSPHRNFGKKEDEVVKLLSSMKDYREMFKKSFGSEEVTMEKITKAIATYERTIVSEVAPFDEWVEGKKDAINDSAKRGFFLFNSKAQCNHCHTSWRFTDDSFQNIGVNSEDKGHGALPDFINSEALQYTFKTPPLRNIEIRAPYMHNGQEKTLTSVVEFYNRGGDVKRASLAITPLSLTKEEIQDVVAFMKTLTTKDRPIVYPFLPVIDQQ